MKQNKWIRGFYFAFCLFITGPIQAQKVVEPSGPADWTKPYPAFRIVGNLYYVGTYDLACYLLVTPAGNILINTGLAASATSIANSVNTLGFKLSDTKILLTTQAHYDHMGAMAVIKKATGAKFWVDEKDAAVVKDGGSSDYALGNGNPSFAPVMPDRFLKNEDSIQLGGSTLVMLHHPGHTKGSCSYLLKVTDENKTYTVLIANMPTIVTSQPLTNIPSYPEAARDYAYTLGAMKKIDFDIWLSSHASQFHLHKKHSPGDTYNPRVFIDPEGYNKALEDLQKEYDAKMNK